MTPPIRSPVWRPSPTRTVIITPPTFIRARGLVQKVMPLSWGLKTSADNLDYYLDASELLCCTKDYIASVTATVRASSGGEPDVEVSWVSIIDGMAALFLGGGTPGTVQQIQVDMTTQQGRIISQPMLVEIASDGVKTDPEPVPTLSDGTPIPPNVLLVSSPRLFFSKILTPDGTQPLLSPAGDPLLSREYVANSFDFFPVTLGASSSSLSSWFKILTPDGSQFLATSDGKPLLAGRYVSHTPLLLIA